MDDKKPETDAVDRRMVLAPRSFSLMPSSLGEAMTLAKMIAESDFAPKDYKGKPGNVVIAIQMGADVGLRPMQALQNIAVINGRPSIWGDAALALCLPVLERFHETISGEGDARTASCTVRRHGFPDEITRTFSVADAKTAKLWGKTGQSGQPTPWVTYPDRMLQLRARGFALRDAASDALMGLILAEEAQDYPAVGVIDVPSTELPAAPPAVQMLERLPEAVKERIGKAFETLQLAPGLRLAKVNEYLGTGEGTEEEKALRLLEWCKTEYASRQGRERAPKDNGKKPQAAPGSETALSSTPDPVSPASPAGAESAPVTAGTPPEAGEIFSRRRTSQPVSDLGF